MLNNKLFDNYASYSASGFHLYIKTGIYFILYLYLTRISKQNWKISFSFRRDSSSKLYKFYRFFSNFHTLWWCHQVTIATIGYWVWFSLLLL